MTAQERRPRNHIRKVQTGSEGSSTVGTVSRTSSTGESDGDGWSPEAAGGGAGDAMGCVVGSVGDGDDGYEVGARFVYWKYALFQFVVAKIIMFHNKYLFFIIC